MKGTIRISKKYGVNPAIPLCFYCNEEKNEIILVGRLMGDVEAPRHAVWDYNPCDKCRDFMQMGIICISVKNGESGDNPYRTGAWAVVKAEAISEMLEGNDILLMDVLNRRVMFIEDKLWDEVGLPRGEVNNISNEKGD